MFSRLAKFCGVVSRKLYNRCYNRQILMLWRAYEGLKLTVNSIIGATEFLLRHSVKYVLTEDFCQGPLANYLSRQIFLGLRKDNSCW